MSPADLTELLPEMITIPGGPFTMGTLDSERSALAKRYGGTRESYAEESPQHIVEVAPFAIARTLVTNELYAAFQQVTGAHRPIVWKGQLPEQLAQHPVVDLSWYEAQALCAWLRNETGRLFRLPTEAEWEKAARGAHSPTFPWGNTFDATCCNVKETGIRDITPVGNFPAGASPYGVLDMAGNVWEWTQSLQAPYPYRGDDGRNEQEPRVENRKQRFLQRLLSGAWIRGVEHALPPVETRRIIRGGCFANPEGFARSACRLRLQPERRTPFLGVRLACDC